MIPRDYQLAAATALWHQVHGRPTENSLVVMPTGSGKSLSMAIFVEGMLRTYPYLRFVNLVHVKELVEGNYKALKTIWPAAPAGIFSAGLGRKEQRQITYAGIGSFRNAVKTFGHVDFVIVDEAHRISDDEKSGYLRVIEELRKVNPNLIVIGFTATDFRMGMGRLTEGKLFDVVCFDLSDGPAFVWMVEQGYLLKPMPKNPGFQVDADKIKIKAGEYDEKSASDAFRDQDILERAVDEIIRTGVEENRQAWLTFTQSIEDCELVADMFRYKGFDVEAVHSQRSDRDEVLAAFRAGKLRGVTNKDILTTGFDDPRIDLIGMLRLTRSAGLWVQMLGRGTRPLWVGHIGHNGGPPLYDISTFEGRRASILASPKQNCRVLDFAGNTMRLGPINYPTIPKQKKKGGGSPPVRECPQCHHYNHISLRCCEECGYEFPVESKLMDHAGTDELVVDLNNLPPPEPKQLDIFRVTQMISAVQRAKPGKWPTLRVDYFCGVRRFSTWVCPEHPGFPSQQAARWWKMHGGVGPMPGTAVEIAAAAATLRNPHYIRVWTNTKYPEIEDYDFSGAAFELPPELGGPPLALETDLAAEATTATEEERIAALAKEMFDDEIPF